MNNVAHTIHKSRLIVDNKTTFKPHIVQMAVNFLIENDDEFDISLI